MEHGLRQVLLAATMLAGIACTASSPSLGEAPSTPTAFSAAVYARAMDGAATMMTRDGDVVGTRQGQIGLTAEAAKSSGLPHKPLEAPDAAGSNPALSATPTPEPTVLAQSVPASAQLTEPEMVALLAEAGFPPETWAKALAVAWCESHWHPGATGAAGERGLFQVHPIHYDSTYDPVGNARAALRISSGGTDWSAWSCRQVLN